MNNKQSLVLLGIITAAAIGILTATSVSAVPFVTIAMPQAEDANGMMGHVELTLKDSDGLVKGYWQFDNLVTDDGDECSAQRLFDDAGSEACNTTTLGFQFIGIGNATTTVNDAAASLGSAATSSTDGLLSIIQEANPLITPNAGAGATAALTNDRVFSFEADTPVSNVTTITDVGLFDAICTVDTISSGQGTCTGAGGNLFALQTVAISTTDGDTLSVTWTITVGGAN